MTGFKQYSVSLVLSDTDSFLYAVSHCKTKNLSFWRTLGDMADLLDTSIYDDDHPYNTENEIRKDYIKYWRDKNAGRIGVFKGEEGSNLVPIQVWFFFLFCLFFFFLFFFVCGYEKW